MADSRPRKPSGSGNSRSSGPPRGGSKSGGPRGGGPKRGGGSGGRGRDDRGGSSGGRSRDDRGGRSGGGSRDDRGGRSGGGGRDDRGGRSGGSRDDRGGRSGGGRDDSRGRSGGGRGGRGGREENERKKTAGPKQWGGVARKGAAKVGEVPYDDRPEFSAEETARYEERVAKRAAEQARRDKLRDEAREAVSRAGDTTPKRPRTRKPKTIERKPLPGRVPQPVDTKISFNRALGETDGRKANRKLGQAAVAFESGRFDDARKLLKPLSDRAPEIPEVQELLGLSLYRMERWQQAADRLEDFRALAGTPEQNPVLADCYRALGRYGDADFFWDELREYSPSAELMTEGRIVAAGVLADQGRAQDAVRLLEQNWKRPKRPFEHHLSRAYALADLYAVVGDEPRSRELFGWIASHAPDFSDAGDRA